MPELVDNIVKAFTYTVDAPVTWFRDKIEILQKRNRYFYYHEKYRRVPTIDQCDVNDILCIYEADMQWRRDRRVDQEITKILRKRMEDCWAREQQSSLQNCKEEVAVYDREARHFGTKYSEMGAFGTARRCFMKQKHRMIEERRRAQEGQKTSSDDD